MKHKIKQTLMTIVGLFLSTTTFAHDFEVDGIYYNFLDKTTKTVEVTRGSNRYSGSITIPSLVVYNGTTYSVTEIDYCAFSYSGLTSVTIPESITYIDSDAFYFCESLTEVNITNLSAWCKINFNNKYANPLYYAKKLNLNGCKITDLVIPNDITEIKEYAFRGCNIVSATIHNSVTKIGIGAFDYCWGLTSVVIGKSVATIEKEAFDYKIKKIIVLNPTPPACSENSFNSISLSNATLYVPKDSYAKYFIDDKWDNFSSIKKIETLVSSISLNETSIELDNGANTTLTAMITPDNATIKNIVWESSNPSIVTISQSGKITAIKPGSATINATAVDGSDVTTSCEIRVNRVESKITLSQTEANLPINDTLMLTYTATPSYTPVKWSTSDANIAYLKNNTDNSIIVVGVANGEAIITATATNGSEASAVCKIIVGTGGVEEVEIENNIVEVARYDTYGRLLSEPAKGINVIKFSDGTIRKEVVK